MRQVAIDAASIPKDAKIAALEKNSAESEKIIAEARSDKMKQFEEMQHSHVSFPMSIVKQLCNCLWVSGQGFGTVWHFSTQISTFSPTLNGTKHTLSLT